MSIRTCIGCRKLCDKHSLVRLVLSGNKVVVDLKGRMSGRGVHVHPQLSCLRKAMNEQLLAHRLRFKKNLGLKEKVKKVAKNKPDIQEASLQLQEEQFEESKESITQDLKIDLSEFKNFVSDLIVTGS